MLILYNVQVETVCNSTLQYFDCCIRQIVTTYDTDDLNKYDMEQFTGCKYTLLKEVNCTLQNRRNVLEIATSFKDWEISHNQIIKPGYNRKLWKKGYVGQFVSNTKIEN